MVITLLGENMAGQTPSQGQLQEWAGSFNLNHPVVADDGMSVLFSYVEGNSVGLPSFSVLDEGAVVLVNDTRVSVNDVIAHLP